MKRSLLTLIAAATLALPSAALGDGDSIILVGQGWECSGLVDVDLVRVTDPGSSAIVLAENCSGRIGRIEVQGHMVDCVKIQNTGAVAHDLVIEGGYCLGTSAPPAAHQDCVQAMGGLRITLRNLVLDCYEGGGGNLFINRAGSGASTPTDIVCEHCAAGPNHDNAGHIRINRSLRSGLRDSLVCQGSGSRSSPIRILSGAVAPVNEGNVVVPNADPSCTFEGLLAYVGGSPPPAPPPPPDPPPPPSPPPPSPPPPPPALIGV